MKITRKSILTGIVREMDLPITLDQLSRWKIGRELIQKVFPDLTADEREFIQTGITPEEWETLRPPEDSTTDES